MASVRQAAIDAIIVKLGNITTANGYTFDVTSDRVYRQADNPETMPTPAVVVIQGEENIENVYSDRYECSLEVIIGCVDQYNGNDPEARANLFLADIQKAMGTEYMVTATPYGSSESGTTTINMLEEGNTITVTDALPGYILGQANYELRYRRHLLDPNKA